MSALRPAVAIPAAPKGIEPAGALIRMALLAGLAAGASPAALGAQVVTGWVLEAGTDSAVAGVEVMLLVGDDIVIENTLTAADGRFVLLPPGQGSYQLRARRIGYGDGRADVVVGEAETVVVEMRLGTEAVVLEPLRVVARDRSLRQRMLRKHYERMERFRHWHGSFMFPRTELARYDTRTYGQFQALAAPHLGWSRGALRAPCQPVVFWDGQPHAPDADLPVSSIEGIEYHRGSGPIDTPFLNPSGCGVILVWTRPTDTSDAFTVPRALTLAGLAGILLLVRLLVPF